MTMPSRSNRTKRFPFCRATRSPGLSPGQVIYVLRDPDNKPFARIELPEFLATDEADAAVEAFMHAVTPVRPVRLMD